MAGQREIRRRGRGVPEAGVWLSQRGARAAWRRRTAKPCLSGSGEAALALRGGCPQERVNEGGRCKVRLGVRTRRYRSRSNEVAYRRGRGDKCDWGLESMSPTEGAWLRRPEVGSPGSDWVRGSTQPIMLSHQVRT